MVRRIFLTWPDSFNQSFLLAGIPCVKAARCLRMLVGLVVADGITASERALRTSSAVSLDDDGTRVPEARYCLDGSGHELGCDAAMSQHLIN